jgi:hypothetical protein
MGPEALAEECFRCDLRQAGYATVPLILPLAWDRDRAEG